MGRAMWMAGQGGGTGHQDSLCEVCKVTTLVVAEASVLVTDAKESPF